MNLRRSLSFLSLLSVLTLWPLFASAHTHLEKSQPEKGAVLTVAPTQVELWFTSKVAAEWSKVTVTDDHGQRVDTGKVEQGDGEKHLRVGLKPIGAGAYHVKLNVVSGDGHRVKGSFSFNVNP